MECSGCIINSNLADNSVTSSKIQDGSIINADISPTAAIDGSKITGTVPNATNAVNAVNADKLDGYHASSFFITCPCGGCWVTSSDCSNCAACGQISICTPAGWKVTFSGYNNCPLCPFFYSWNGREYVKDTTIIYKLDSPEKEADQLRELKHLDLSGTIKAKIVEEEKETSYIDMVKILVVDQQGDSKREFELGPVYSSEELDKILYSDNQYLVMNQGDEISLEFEKAPALENGWTRQVYIKAEGYYIQQ